MGSDRATLPRDLPDIGLGAAHGHAEAPSEVSGERERPRHRARCAVRMVEEHREAHASEWAVLQSVASKIGCTTETLRKWR